MCEQERVGACCNNSDKFDSEKLHQNTQSDVPQVSSRDVVLAFLDDHDIPLQPKSIYGGLISNQDITFSYRTVQNIISEFAEEGLIQKVRIDTDEGVVEEMAPSESGRAYYLITNKGREKVSEELTG